MDKLHEPHEVNDESSQLDLLRTAMFEADRSCRHACDRMIMPPGLDKDADAMSHKELREDLRIKIGIVENAYRSFFNAVCSAWPNKNERESCLEDIVFRHRQQVRSLAYISGGKRLLRPLVEILDNPVADILMRHRISLESVGLATRESPTAPLQDEYIAEVIAPFSGLDVEDLMANKETGANIEWLAQQLAEEDELQTAT